MKPIRAVVIAAAAATVAMIPAAASASTTTIYTKSYAGYYAAGTGVGSDWTYTVYLPQFSKLAKITNGVTSEERIASNYGTFEFQLGANPQTQTAWHTKLEGPFPTVCSDSSGNLVSSLSFPQGDTVNEQLGMNDSNDWSVITLTYSDAAGWEGECSFRIGDFTGPWPTYKKVSFVDAFNPKSFKAPASPVLLGSFANIVSPYVTGLTYFPHGKYIATSTGTATGTKRAVPSTLNSTGSGFTVTIP